MNVAIIHKKSRTDRDNNVSELTRYFGNVTVFDAIEPYWETGIQKAVRGCSLSHLALIEGHLDSSAPLLVLEDDAKILPEVWERYKLLENLPGDVGAILTGWDALSPLQPKTEYGLWEKVLPPIYGSQAVVYHPKQLGIKFLYRAYKLLASNGTGFVTQTQPCLCYESVLMQSLLHLNKYVYKSKELAFDQITTYSDRGTG